MDTIYIGNDHTVTLNSLVDSAGGPVTSASIAVTLLERDSLDPVSGVTWPITLVHIADGTYTGTIDKAVEVVKSQKYVLRIIASAGTSDAQWDIEVMGVWRQ